LSLSSCGSTIFGEVAPILNLVPQILLLASNIRAYLDVWDPVMISRQEQVLPHLIIVEEYLRGFGV
jgi:hypothetical protein